MENHTEVTRAEPAGDAAFVCRICGREFEADLDRHVHDAGLLY